LAGGEQTHTKPKKYSHGCHYRVHLRFGISRQ
jgi:hypothetical protein